MWEIFVIVLTVFCFFAGQWTAEWRRQVRDKKRFGI